MSGWWYRTFNHVRKKCESMIHHLKTDAAYAGIVTGGASTIFAGGGQFFYKFFFGPFYALLLSLSKVSIPSLNVSEACIPPKCIKIQRIELSYGNYVKKLAPQARNFYTPHHYGCVKNVQA